MEDYGKEPWTEKEDLWRRMAILDGWKEILNSGIVGDNLDIEPMIGNSPTLSNCTDDSVPIGDTLPMCGAGTDAGVSISCLKV